MMTRHPSSGQNHKAPYFWICVAILKANPSCNSLPSLGPSSWVPLTVQSSGPLLLFHFGVFFITGTQHRLGEQVLAEVCFLTPL